MWKKWGYNVADRVTKCFIKPLAPYVWICHKFGKLADKAMRVCVFHLAPSGLMRHRRGLMLLFCLLCPSWCSLRSCLSIFHCILLYLNIAWVCVGWECSHSLHLVLNIEVNLLDVLLSLPSALSFISQSSFASPQSAPLIRPSRARLSLLPSTTWTQLRLCVKLIWRQQTERERNVSLTKESICTQTFSGLMLVEKGGEGGEKKTASESNSMINTMRGGLDLLTVACSVSMFRPLRARPRPPYILLSCL